MIINHNKHLLRSALVICTILYLLFELSFSARLLDVLGSQYNQNIHNLERYGRMFSGIALSLLFFNSIFSSLTHPLLKGFIYIVVLLLSIMFMWLAQESVINYIKSQYSLEEKSKFSYLSLSSGLVATGEIKIPGLSELDIEASPNGLKALTALYPYIYRADPKQYEFSSAVKDKIMDFQVTSSCDVNDVGKMCLGKLSQFYANIWMPARQKIVSKIEEDIKSYHDALTPAAVHDATEKGWHDFVSSAEQAAGRRLDQIKNSWIANRSIRAQTIKSLSPYLSRNWQLTDKQSFKTAYARKYIEVAKREPSKQFKAKIPNTITTSWVFAQPETQWIINEKFGVVGPVEKDPNMISIQKSLGINHHADDEKNLIYFDYNATKESDIKKTYQALVSFYKKRSQPIEFKASGNLGKKYYDQYLDRVVIPFVALMFSLTGGMLHLVKLNVVISGFLTDKKSIKYGLALLLILAVMLIPEFKNNSITNSDAFVNVNQTRPVAESQAIKWIINTEDLMYPINESIRTHVLMGFSFQ